MLTHVCDSQNISAFSLVNDTIWQGLYTDYTRAEFATGGFTTYHGAQVSLRGRRSTRYFKDVNYVVSYALARNEAINGAGRVEFRAAMNDNLKWNSKQNYGPNGLDYTHILRVAGTVGMPGGFWLSPLVS